MKKEKQYPIVKYRVVNGNGYSVCDTWEEVQKRIEHYKTNPLFKDNESFQVKYVVKVTEEKIDI